MPIEDHDLLEQFPHTKVLGKAAISFVGLLGAIQVLAGWSEPVEQARLWVYSEKWAVPLFGVAFYCLYLIYECVIRSQRLTIEKLRSDPQEPRRKAVKAARQQRLRNQRNRRG